MRVVPRKRRSVEHRERDGVDVAAAVGQVAARVHVHGAGRCRRHRPGSGSLATGRLRSARRRPRGPGSSDSTHVVVCHDILAPRCVGNSTSVAVSSGCAARASAPAARRAASMVGVGRQAAGGAGIRRSAGIVHGRAGDVDQPTVGGHVGLESAPERGHTAGTLDPRDVVGAGDVDVVLPQVERPQVGAAQAERQEMWSGRSPYRSSGPAWRSRRSGSHPACRSSAVCRSADRRSRRLGSPGALRARSAPYPPPGWVSRTRRSRGCRTAPSSLASRNGTLSSARLRRRGDRGGDGDDEQRGERRDGGASTCADLFATPHERLPSGGTIRTTTTRDTRVPDRLPTGLAHVRARNRNEREGRRDAGPLVVRVESVTCRGPRIPSRP